MTIKKRAILLAAILLGLVMAQTAVTAWRDYTRMQNDAAVETLVAALRNHMVGDMMHDALRGTVYRALYGAMGLWVRPHAMFFETVVVDGVAQRACLQTARGLQGRSITTIEGLAAADGTLHPVQQAVVDEQGFQCAFCMPGFVMATVGFLKTNPNPTRRELAHGVCRLGFCWK